MPTPTTPRTTILTGDRTTGALHLGHYVGSLRNRLALQHGHDQYLLLADAQALTDNAHDPEKISRNVIEVALDYLAVGIDPALSTICVQSALPALAELTMLYLNFVTLARLERNPTIKDEIHARGFGRDIPAGFLCYPAAQAADITAFKATLVPVGEDQAPIIEQTNEIVRRLNRQVGRTVLPEARALIPQVGRLPGVDGRAKMSKSQGNAIPLSASDEEIAEAVRRMYTDPNHLRASDSGQVEGNVVFTYLDAFDEDRAAVADLKAQYRRGGLGDMVLKRRLTALLQALLAPIRERRAALARDRDFVLDVLRTGTRKARAVTEATKAEVVDALGLFHLPGLGESPLPVPSGG
jgi:tryptophanyl-tRNA synthetase